MICPYLQEQREKLGRSDYLPASAWHAVESCDPPICARTGMPCEAEDNPESCAIQEQLNFICPTCLWNHDSETPLRRNAAGMYNCQCGHTFGADGCDLAHDARIVLDMMKDEIRDLAKKMARLKKAAA